MLPFLCFCSALLALVAATELPVIDISPLLSNSGDSTLRSKVVKEIGAACRQVGFFYISNHGVDAHLQQEIESMASEFFNLSDEEKLSISMDKGGKAWRGSFLVGNEVTSGIPDQKEGLYFGKEIRFNASESRPLHGSNLWPAGNLGRRMKSAVLTYMDEMTRLGSLLMSAIVESLGVTATAFGQQFADPTVLFRMFHYPPHDPAKFSPQSVGVGEHTDYGYLTILKQDGVGGLQAKTPQRTTRGGKDKTEMVWVDVPPMPNTFVVNLGDALQHNTGGLFLATTHRVQQRTTASSSRYSFPFFFDPSFTARMVSVQNLLSDEDQRLAAANREMLTEVHRWDRSDPAQYTGSYGDYLVGKVAKVFPELAELVNLTGTAKVSPAATTGSRDSQELKQEQEVAVDIP